jgi:hypothetical protein
MNSFRKSIFRKYGERQARGVDVEEGHGEL